jgi:hypothetical protein
MKSEGTLKHFVVALLLAVGCYALFYPSIEHRRTRKGPWEVTFAQTNGGVPLLVIDQPKLAITNVQVLFADQVVSGQTNTHMMFSEAKPVPFAAPFGKCVFMDTTFLPGTLTFQLFDHEIELLPRVLVIDQQEHPWVSNSTITLHPVRTPPARPAAARQEGGRGSGPDPKPSAITTRLEGARN